MVVAAALPVEAVREKSAPAVEVEAWVAVAVVVAAAKAAAVAAVAAVAAAAEEESAAAAILGAMEARVASTCAQADVGCPPLPAAGCSH